MRVRILQMVAAKDEVHGISPKKLLVVCAYSFSECPLWHLRSLHYRCHKPENADTGTTLLLRSLKIEYLLHEWQPNSPFGCSRPLDMHSAPSHQNSPEHSHQQDEQLGTATPLVIQATSYKMVSLNLVPLTYRLRLQGRSIPRQTLPPSNQQLSFGSLSKTPCPQTSADSLNSQPCTIRIVQAKP
jgi:hypothetical protein